MPRKVAKQLFRYALKHAFPGSDKNLTVKVFAARKFHTSSQGVLYNQKLSGGQEYKRSRSQVQPLILRQRASFTTFASLPVHQREAALKGHRSFQLKVKGLPSADPAPTFAAEPIWRKQFHSAVAEYKETERRRNLARTRERLAAIPLWRYARMDPAASRAETADTQHHSSRRVERGAMRWYANLERDSGRQNSMQAPVARKQPAVPVRSALRAFASLDNAQSTRGTA